MDFIPKRNLPISRCLFILAPIICLFAISCTNSKNSSKNSPPGKTGVIDLESAVGSGKIINLSDVASDIRYVKLETNDSSVIGQYPTVFYENERFYILSMRVLKVFDKDGKFLFKFDRRGRGAQEYVMSRHITVMSGSGNLLVQTQGPGAGALLMYYDREGRYVTKRALPYNKNTFHDKVVELNDNLLVAATSPRYTDSVQLSAIIYDSAFNILKTIPTPSITEFEKRGGDDFVVISDNGKEIPSAKLSAIRSPLIYRFKNNIRFLVEGNDTIFSLDFNQNFSPVFSVNHGKYKMVKTDNSEMNLNKGDYITLREVYYIESEENIILQFYMRDFCHEPYEVMISTRRGVITNHHTDCYALYNKKTGAFTLLNQPVKNMLGFREDIKNGPPFLPSSISLDLRACALFTASQIIEHAQKNDVEGELKEIVKDLKDTDNPVVAIAKMK